jgi:hypothetical protein
MKCYIRKPYRYFYRLPFGSGLAARARLAGSKKWLAMWAYFLLAAMTFTALVIVEEINYGLAANLYGNFYLSVIYSRPLKLRGSLPSGVSTLLGGAVLLSLTMLGFRKAEKGWNRCDRQPEPRYCQLFVSSVDSWLLFTSTRVPAHSHRSIVKFNAS